MMPTSIPRIVAFTAAACSLTTALAQAVPPPPLPESSRQIRVEPGEQSAERKRSTRAHQHKWTKKDYTKDDSVEDPNPAPSGNPKK